VGVQVGGLVCSSLTCKHCKQMVTQTCMHATCIRLSTCTYTHTHKRARAHTHVDKLIEHTSIHINVHSYASACRPSFVRFKTHASTHMRKYKCTHKNTHKHKQTHAHTRTHSLIRSHTHAHTPRGRLGPHGRHAVPELHAALLQTYTQTHTLTHKHKRMRTHIFSPITTLHRLNDTMLTKNMFRKKIVDSMLLHGMHVLGETERTGPSFLNPSPAPPLDLPPDSPRHIPAAL